jgi:D-tagatose-1,6-bisphosphate aldolase subunit GatZ/KbaZ
VFEAHSTDYQSPDSLAALVRDHFAILKVGPGATFALRETLWGLAAIEQELFRRERVPDLRRVVVDVMKADPRHWKGHYAADGNGLDLDLDLQYSLSDRIRYYWPNPEVRKASDAMLERLGRKPIPLTLLSQYLPHEHEASACRTDRAGTGGDPAGRCRPRASALPRGLRPSPGAAP